MGVNRTYYSEKFRDRLQMDTLTGSLTINDSPVSTPHIRNLAVYQSVHRSKSCSVVYSCAWCISLTELVVRLVLSALVGVAMTVLLFHYFRQKRHSQAQP
ncbi:unnamed protein product [Oncorhynchus mykiss]|uniref:Uncharacterized protein n=1 Tax=Oncorhynchus mykiss TaxID=8022 RepID=A0A060X4P5_ONCMY|nr:unnamed protein product [Oncorhynchus mykiss]